MSLPVQKFRHRIPGRRTRRRLTDTSQNSDGPVNIMKALVGVKVDFGLQQRVDKQHGRLTVMTSVRCATMW